ncbi:MAG: hypothetical protein SPL40_02330, partial [Erysipelotrichaceae bacterium]|nr:hypothetical protein [Erysipelotrichaceae bacterium]
SHLFPSRTQKLSTAGADIAFGKVCTPPGSLEKIYPIFSFLYVLEAGLFGRMPSFRAFTGVFAVIAFFLCV